MTTLSPDELDELRFAAEYMARGTLGGFVAKLGDAMLAADPHNLDRLSCAFPELVREAWEQRTRRARNHAEIERAAQSIANTLGA
jgi:hypothetical protein